MLKQNPCLDNDNIKRVAYYIKHNIFSKFYLLKQKLDVIAYIFLHITENKKYHTC